MSPIDTLGPGENEYSLMMKRLNELEHLLTSLFEEIEYIGEVPLRRDEYIQLTHDLKSHLEYYGLTKTTRKLKGDWPHIFITYLSITAAYNDNRGYWQAFVDNLGVTSTNSIFGGNNHWGKLYVEILNQFGLDSFSDQKFNFPYVTPIRLQGGIPRYSLPDFFEHIILPSVELSDLKYLVDEEALIAVQDRSGARYSVDKVVKLYLKNGGEFAEKFFSRCREMARIAVKGEPLPAPSALKLRPFVVQLFEDYLANRIDKRTDQRIFSPRLTFWPHQPAYSLDLPEQTIPDSSAHNKYQWHIRFYIDGQLVKDSYHPVRVYRRGLDIQTKSLEVPVEHPYHKAIIDFGFLKKESGQQIFHSVRMWPLRLLPERELQQIMAFNHNGKVIRVAEGLPADYCWLVVPKDTSIKVIGTGKRIEEVNSYWQPWDCWRAELWDLSCAQIVEITNPNNQKKNSLPVVQPIPEPILVEGIQIPYSRMVDEIPLYIGKSPNIQITPGGRAEERRVVELDDWSLEIRSIGQSRPMVNQRYELKDEEFILKAEDGSINLSVEHILGADPVGTFEVILVHSDGKEFDRSFRIWPDLEIHGLEPLILPDREGGKTVKLDFVLPQGTQLDYFGDTHHPNRKIEIHSIQEPDKKRYKVIIPPTVTTGSFVLSYPVDKDNIRVPIEICIPRLRWSIRFDADEEEKLNWHTNLINVPLPKIIQSDQAQLFISAELPKQSNYKISFSLTLPGKGEELQSLSQKTLSDHESRCKCNINILLDTIKKYESEPLFDLEVELEGGHLHEAIRLPIVRISRTINVRNVWLETTENNLTSIHWNEPKPLQHRRVLIWSLWQPWKDPIEVKLPDNPPESDSGTGDSWYMYQFPPEVPGIGKGCYGVRFIAVPTWEERPIPAFPPDDIRIVEIGDPEQRIIDLNVLISTEADDLFLLYYERACILHDLGRRDERDRDISWCSSNANRARIPVLISFYYWLDEKDSLTQRALRLRMIKPDWLLNLFLRIESPDLRIEYLRPLLEEESIRSESARIILDHAVYPEIISMAVNALVDDEDKYVVQYMLEQIEGGKFSVLGAFEVLKPCADFAIYAMLELTETPNRSRLLQELSIYTEMPLIIYPGWWIRSDAGWGKIDNINDVKMDRRLEYFHIDKDTPLLKITLRPGDMQINIQVDLSERQILFPAGNDYFMCSHNSDCFHYITDNREEIYNVHNREAHGGERSANRPVKNQIYSMRHTVEYSAKTPKNIYL